MIGAIFGDIAGSRFEFCNIDRYDFDLYNVRDSYPTDDSVCTLAVADYILNGGDVADKFRSWCLKYPDNLAGYGGGFRRWLHTPNAQPYNSYGNGAVMRVSPVAWAGKDEKEVQDLAGKVTIVSHNHPEGMRGASAIATAIWRLRHPEVYGEKNEIVDNILTEFYPDATYDWFICQRGVFDETSQGTAVISLFLFKESESFEDAVRRAVSFGGDSDTLGAVVGSLAEAYYGVTEKQRKFVKDVLNNIGYADYWDTIEAFENRYGNKIKE